MSEFLEEEPDPDALEQMRERSKNLGAVMWAAYQNQALDSRNAGHLQFLMVGPGCTFPEPPQKYPKDNEHGMGWRYLFVGYVDLESGKVRRKT